MSIAQVGGPTQAPQSANIKAHAQMPTLLKKHLEAQPFREVLGALGVNPKNITHISRQEGISGQLRVADLRLIEIDNKVKNVIKALGLGNVELAIVLGAQNQSASVKKKLKEIHDSMLDKEVMRQLLPYLGLKEDADAIGFTDNAGGLLVLQMGFKSLEDAFKEDVSSEESKNNEEERSN